ncbi:unnamed protein product [Taenia asiatica]|uniref:Sterile alpha and TIR motif-containing protein 1 n=1 Tax=Taenia asiatica TaxID=60517 RepID=A0A0R3WBH4_TAEAS|nr:unnamed protein product [Taenia asiatica]
MEEFIFFSKNAGAEVELAQILLKECPDVTEVTDQHFYRGVDWDKGVPVHCGNLTSPPNQHLKPSQMISIEEPMSNLNFTSPLLQSKDNIHCVVESPANLEESE